MRERKRIYYPQGDQHGKRRPRKPIRYEYVPFTPEDIRPYDILLTRSKSIHGPLIVFFSQSDQRSAWLSHAGQVLGDGKTISEADYPYHKFTPVSKYMQKQEEGVYRITVCRLVEDIWPDAAFRKRAEEECEIYHRALHRNEYSAISGLLPMMMVSILRNAIPFLKRGKWKRPPTDPETGRKIFICSALIKYGWGWAQRELGEDWFPSSLSLEIPSPQDIYDATSTKFVAGWRRTQ